jgi:hypothetical protein
MPNKIEEGVVIQNMYGGKVEVKFLGPTAEKTNRHMYFANGKRVLGATTFCGIKDKSRALISWATGMAEDFLLEKMKAKQAIDEATVYEACSLHEQYLQQAADIGKAIHAWCEEYIRHELREKGAKAPEMPEDPAVQIGAASFMAWVKVHNVTFISTERVVYSKKHEYMGTFDIEAIVDGKLCLVDLKSGNGMYNEVRMQTAAYLKADEEARHAEKDKVKYGGRWAIRLAKETEAEYVARMQKKNDKKAMMGKAVYPIKPYQVFEALFLDDVKTNLTRDFKAFLAAKELYEWNRDTDTYGKD